ncbi:hypothetical protein SO802_023411 [Lithocarpus litseifolius]|uniref:Uncharacterized protein n=1 Tax=Lithocarpus litseifolius TaxID=425828 RepID=A0AAW2C8B5_9ROSI
MGNSLVLTVTVNVCPSHNYWVLQHSLGKKHVRMEISIKLDLDDKYSLDYEVNINGEKFKINTTWAVQNDCQVYQLSRWLYEIHRIYGKKNRRNLVVGLGADRSHGYRGGRCKDTYVEKESDSFTSFLDIDFSLYDQRGGREAWKGEGFVHEELGGASRMRAEEKCSKGNNFSRPKLAALAKEVLGEDMHFEKPNGLIWWSEMYYDVLSDDVVMYATVEAFLTCRIGSKLLRCSCCTSALEELWARGIASGGGLDDVLVDWTIGKDVSPREHLSCPGTICN